MAFLFDIKRYSINDGPGVRITVFFKGCPLTCQWCHNPESLATYTERLYNKSKCIACELCVNCCPEKALTLSRDNIILIDSEKCKQCGVCATVCPTKAIEMVGKHYSKEAVMSVILREISIIDASGGGVTFSGGEPLLYPKELKELLIECGEENIHRVVDTSGYAKQTVFEEIAAHTDLFLFDLKHMDPTLHKQLTGVSNELILKNLKWLATNKKDYHIRIPLIKGANMNMDNIKATADFLLHLDHKPLVVGLLPYHNIAVNKYQKLGKAYDSTGISEPNSVELNAIVEYLTERGFKTVIGG